jgi:O-acetylhomoserine/O-acetylserine sulfhydrylase-like pyridoxal-dependent enzyme
VFKRILEIKSFDCKLIVTFVRALNNPETE